ncbi:MAG TPA: hypothetical protein VL282_01580 [Tepidisphaeraceae bacterium]|jgi:hypothetical protein|nr:hypothetical protein [Tepidisphaeraceae bacterium]
MIHLPAMGVAYFFWRRLRLALAALLANIALLAVVSRAFADKEYLPILTLCTLLPLVIGSIHMLSVFTYGPTDFGAATTGFPRYMLVHPMRACSMVGWPMLYGALTIGLLCLLVFGAVAFPAEIKTAGIFVGFFIACLAWFQVSAWISFPVPVLRAIFLILMVFGMSAGGVSAIGRESSEHLVAAGYFLAALLAYGVAVVGLSRARRGEGQTWSLAPLWERFISSFSKRKTFSSPLRAQLWLELRRNALYLPMLTLLTCLPMLLPLLGKQRNEIYIADHSVSARMLAVIIMIAFPLFCSGAFSFAIGKFDFWSNKVPTFNSFFSTRAFSTTNFIVAKWLAAVISSVLVWVIVVLLLTTFFISSTADERAHILRVFGGSIPASIGRLTLIFLLLAFIIWRNQVTGFFIPMLGRGWFTNAFGVWSWLQFGLIGGIGIWIVKDREIRNLLTAHITAIIFAIAIIKVVITSVVLRILKQRSIVPASQWKKLSAIWIAWGIALLATLCGIMGPRAMLIPVAILMLPMIRIALAPLTLSLNRHR